MIRSKFRVYDDETLKMLKRAVGPTPKYFLGVRENETHLCFEGAEHDQRSPDTLLASVLPTACISDEVSSRGNEPVKAGLRRWRKRSIELTAKSSQGVQDG